MHNIYSHQRSKLALFALLALVTCSNSYALIGGQGFASLKETQRKRLGNLTLMAIGFTTPWWRCSGIAISANTMLTAAHCLESDGIAPGTKITIFQTVVTNNWAKEESMLATINKIIIPENYKLDSDSNDLALVTIAPIFKHHIESTAIFAHTRVLGSTKNATTAIYELASLLWGTEGGKGHSGGKLYLMGWGDHKRFEWNVIESRDNPAFAGMKNAPYRDLLNNIMFSPYVYLSTLDPVVSYNSNKNLFIPISNGKLQIRESELTKLAGTDEYGNPTQFELPYYSNTNVLLIPNLSNQGDSGGPAFLCHTSITTSITDHPHCALIGIIIGGRKNDKEHSKIIGLQHEDDEFDELLTLINPAYDEIMQKWKSQN